MRKMAILVGVLFLASSLVWAGESEPYHVLLVNDDGVDSPGIEARAARVPL